VVLVDEVLVVVVTIVDVVLGSRVVDVVEVDDVVVDGTTSVVLVVELVDVVVGTPGQEQSAAHSVKAPPGLVGGQVRLPGGSHCSPGSGMLLPQSGAVVEVVEVDDVVVVVGTPGQEQSAAHSVKAPPGLVGGHVRLPGGSHCSPGSGMLLPQSGGVVDVVEVDDVVVVVGTPGQEQSAAHSVKAPPGLVGGQVRLPGGSHCSPGSGMLLPQRGAVVEVVDVEDVEVDASIDVEDVEDVDVVVVLAAGFFSDGTQRNTGRRTVGVIVPN
jgi:hypothetical protein